MTKLEKRGQWHKHIEAWQSSGLSQKEYCLAHQLKSHQFWYWRRQFRSHMGSETVTTGKKTPVTLGAFVPVQSAPTQAAPFPPLPGTSPSSTTPSVTLPNGIHIHGVTHMPLPQLTALVRGLL